MRYYLMFPFFFVAVLYSLLSRTLNPMDAELIRDTMQKNQLG